MSLDDENDHTRTLSRSEHDAEGEKPRATQPADQTPEQLIESWQAARDRYDDAQQANELAYQDTAFEHFKGSFDQFQEARATAAGEAFDRLYSAEQQLSAAGYVRHDNDWLSAEEDEAKRRAGRGGGDFGNPAQSQLAANIRPDIESAPGGLVTVTTAKNSERPQDEAADYVRGRLEDARRSAAQQGRAEAQGQTLDETRLIMSDAMKDSASYVALDRQAPDTIPDSDRPRDRALANLAGDLAEVQFATASEIAGWDKSQGRDLAFFRSEQAALSGNARLGHAHEYVAVLAETLSEHFEYSNQPDKAAHYAELGAAHGEAAQFLGWNRDPEPDVDRDNDPQGKTLQQQESAQRQEAALRAEQGDATPGAEASPESDYVASRLKEARAARAEREGGEGVERSTNGLDPGRNPGKGGGRGLF